LGYGTPVPFGTAVHSSPFQFVFLRKGN